MSIIKRLNPKTLPDTSKTGGVTRLICVGETVYLAQTAPVDRSGKMVGTGDFSTQMDQVYANLGTAMEAVGGTLNDLVKTNVLITHPDYYPHVGKGGERILGSRPPVNTTVILPLLDHHPGGNPASWIYASAIGVLGEASKKRECINPPGLFKPEGYSNVVKVGNVVYISAQMALDKDGKVVGKSDPNAQAKKIWENLERCLRAAGSNREDLVTATTFYTHPFYYDALMRAQEDFFGTDLPASTGVVVSYLPESLALLQTEGIAVIGGKKRRINPDSLFKSKGSSNIVEVDGMVFIAGQVPVDGRGNLIGKCDFEKQFTQVNANMEAAVRAVGGYRSSIVRAPVYFTRPEDYSSICRLRVEFYEGNPPTPPSISGIRLANPDWMVQVDAIAILE